MSFNLDPQKMLSTLESWTQEGRSEAVLDALIGILKEHPDKKYLPDLARLAGRNHNDSLGLRILHPVISADRENIQSANDRALLVYATILLKIGALEESGQYLKRVKSSVEATLRRAFLLIMKWDYSEAIPLLKLYIQSPEPTAYQKIIAKVNLLASYIAVSDLKSGESLLNELKATLVNEPNYRVLFGNCLELQAQMEILKDEFFQALRTLNYAQELMLSQGGRYLLYIHKWKAIADLCLSPKSSEARSALLKVRAEALASRNWETLRDCDFHYARLTGDHELIQRILLGTPYKSYHERILKVYGISPANRCFEYCPGDVLNSPRDICLDLTDRKLGVTMRPTSWSLIQLMAQDIYQPPRLGKVFAFLYPKEYFNPFTSPQRVSNCLYQFNHWSESSNCGLRIQVQYGDYILHAPPSHGVRVKRTFKADVVPEWLRKLQFLRLQIGPRSFTSAQAAKILGVTRPTIVTLLNKGITTKRIKRSGEGKNSRYIFASNRAA